MLKGWGFFFLEMFVVLDWQLVLFEVCVCVSVWVCVCVGFEVGRGKKKQWHHSCALNIWRGFKQPNILPRQEMKAESTEWGRCLSITITTITFPSHFLNSSTCLFYLFASSSDLQFNYSLFSPSKLNLSASSVLSLCLFHPPVRRKQALASLLKKTSRGCCLLLSHLSVLCLFSYSIHMVVHCVSVLYLNLGGRWTFSFSP